MKVSKEEECWLYNGRPNANIFKYCIYRTMTIEMRDWLHKNFKGYGQDYYYSHGKIWFKTGKQETFFLLRWS